MSVYVSPDARAELREAEALWRLHLGGCAVCRRAERVHGLYCERGRSVYRQLRAAKRVIRRLSSL